MNFNDIERLIDKINNSEISLFEMKLDNNYIKMDKSSTRNSNETVETVETVKEVSTKTSESIKVEEEPNNFIKEKTDSIAISKVEDIKEENLYVVKAPMVGTFYTAPGVGIDPFVKIGDSIKEGTTLCIIEAMKLMNEIESEVSGEIVEILVDNEAMVEYGTELFKIRR